MEERTFKFKTNQKVVASTYKFNVQCTAFLTMYQMTEGFVQECYFNAKEIKEGLKGVKALKIPHKKGQIKILKAPEADNELSYRRFFAYLATWCLSNDYVIINPLAESYGLSLDDPTDLTRKVYYGCTPGAYMNVTDFGFIPSLFEYKRITESSDREASQLWKYYGKYIRVKDEAGVSVANMLEVSANLEEAKTVLALLDRTAGSGTTKLIKDAKSMFKKLSEEFEKMTTGELD